MSTLSLFNTQSKSSIGRMVWHKDSINMFSPCKYHFQVMWHTYMYKSPTKCSIVSKIQYTYIKYRKLDGNKLNTISQGRFVNIHIYIYKSLSVYHECYQNNRNTKFTSGDIYEWKYFFYDHKRNKNKFSVS